jgi:hypothetical protein
MCGVSRLALYRVLWTGRVNADMAELLSPLVRAFEVRKLRFRRTGRYGNGVNRWELSSRRAVRPFKAAALL